MARYLVVANQTLSTEPLLAQIAQCMEAEPSTFHVLVPATHPRDHAAWTEGHARTIAAGRLESALARLRELGADVTGEVGDASPMVAIRDALIGQTYDAVIVSTLPSAVSRWLKQDLPHRIERNLGLRVIHVGSLAAAQQ